MSKAHHKKVPWNELPTDVKRAEAFEKELKNSSSTDPLIHLAWIVQGYGIYIQTKGKRGHSLKNAQRYVVANTIAYAAQRAIAELLEIKKKTTDLGARLAIDKRIKQLGGDDV